MFELSHMQIPSAIPDWSIDAWKYLPKAPGRPKSADGLPVIIMAHGLCANKLAGLAPFAEAFASMQYAVVVFDYRRWGASAGTPRHIIYVSEQLEDYRTVIKHCRQQPEIDPHKVILWGTSLSGGHVVTLAAEKELNLTAAIAQCPYLGTGPPTKLSWTLVKMFWKGVQDVLRQAFGLYPTYIPAVAQPGEVAYISAPGAKQGMLTMVQNQSDFPNEVSASSLFELPFYNPLASAARITCPVLVIAAERDNLCPLQTVMELKGLSPRVELAVLPCGHFEVYTDPMREKALEAMTAFLLQRTSGL
ncbi:alpha/beta-hydrolase [Pilatotrama ljubarskyi]|nr:alpha/beta-hydrolase [Pilatotrama ljubarskyi]